jgi:two-component system phosphate regulon sensor histidine kinase PhoR
MFKQKNLSPKQLAALTALLLSSIIATSVFLLMYDWRYWVGYFLVCFIFAYLLIHQILDFFVYRKIKLIYKCHLQK